MAAGSGLILELPEVQAEALVRGPVSRQLLAPSPRRSPSAVSSAIADEEPAVWLPFIHAPRTRPPSCAGPPPVKEHFVHLRAHKDDVTTMLRRVADEKVRKVRHHTTKHPHPLRTAACGTAYSAAYSSTAASTAAMHSSSLPVIKEAAREAVRASIAEQQAPPGEQLRELGAQSAPPPPLPREHLPREQLPPAPAVPPRNLGSPRGQQHSVTTPLQQQQALAATLSGFSAAATGATAPKKGGRKRGRPRAGELAVPFVRQLTLWAARELSSMGLAPARAADSDGSTNRGLRECPPLGQDTERSGRRAGVFLKVLSELARASPVYGPLIDAAAADLSRHHKLQRQVLRTSGEEARRATMAASMAAQEDAVETVDVGTMPASGSGMVLGDVLMLSVGGRTEPISTMRELQYLMEEQRSNQVGTPDEQLVKDLAEMKAMAEHFLSDLEKKRQECEELRQQLAASSNTDLMARQERELVRLREKLSASEGAAAALREELEQLSEAKAGREAERELTDSELRSLRSELSRRLSKPLATVSVSTQTAAQSGWFKPAPAISGIGGGTAARLLAARKGRPAVALDKVARRLGVADPSNRQPPLQGLVAHFVAEIQGDALAGLWALAPWCVRAVLQTVHECMRRWLGQCEGHELGAQGGRFTAVLPSLQSAARFALAVQRELAAACWPEEAAGRLPPDAICRAAVATGPALTRLDDVTERCIYVGSTVELCALMCAACPPGLVACGAADADKLPAAWPDGSVSCTPAGVELDCEDDVVPLHFISDFSMQPRIEAAVARGVSLPPPTRHPQRVGGLNVLLAVEVEGWAELEALDHVTAHHSWRMISDAADTLIAMRRGRRAKLPGDGCGSALAVFAKAEEAASCAAALQEEAMRADWPEQLLRLPPAAPIGWQGVDALRGLRLKVGLHQTRCLPPPAVWDPVRPCLEGEAVALAHLLAARARGGEAICDSAVAARVAECHKREELLMLRADRAGMAPVPFCSPIQVWRLLPRDLYRARSDPPLAVDLYREAACPAVGSMLGRMVDEGALRVQLRQKCARLESAVMAAEEADARQTAHLKRLNASLRKFASLLATGRERQLRVYCWRRFSALVKLRRGPAVRSPRGDRFMGREDSGVGGAEANAQGWFAAKPSQGAARPAASPRAGGGRRKSLNAAAQKRRRSEAAR